MRERFMYYGAVTRGFEESSRYVQKGIILRQRLILHAQGWELITKPECLVIRRPAPCFTGTTSSVKGLSELLRYTNFVSSVLAQSTESLHERYKSALYLLRSEARTSEKTNVAEKKRERKW